MEHQGSTYRKLLAASISGLLLQAGFDTCEKESLGSLTELLQCFITEVGMLSRNYCELSGRCEPLIADVILAFSEMGIDFSTLDSFIKCNLPVLPTIQIQQPPKQLNMLQAGVKQDFPSYFQTYHLPPFPDPHAYVRTPTHKQPIIDYESVREKTAAQKKDIEKALTKFLSKTSPITHNLFDTEDTNIFPLIASTPPYPPYLSALLPQDQIFDAEDLEYDPKSQLMQQAKAAKERKPKDLKSEGAPSDSEEKLNDSIKNEENTSNVFIDNPYLAATKLPKKDFSEA